MTISRERKSKPSAPASVPARPHLLAWLKNPKNAAAYIEVALSEGNSGDLLHALRNVAEARGGIARIAERTGLNREALYRTLSKRGNPQLKSLAAILIQADRFGSSIAQALRVQSDSMRTRRRQIAEEKAAATAVKLIFPLVLFIFPAIFVVLVGPAAILIQKNLLSKG